MKPSIFHRSAKLLAVFIVATGLALPGAGFAAIRTVTSSQDSASPTAGMLRYEIAHAVAGDTIVFASGLNGKSITLKAGELVVDKDLTIRGPGVTKLTISGKSSSRVFSIQAEVFISGLTITKGSVTGEGGGAILNLGILHLNASAVTSSKADDGGGIYNLGDLMMDQCSIGLNRATGSGGGIYNQGNLVIRRSTIYDNDAAANGGGVNEFIGSATYINSTFALNTAAGNGGGLNDDGATLDFYNCTFSKNKAAAGGGLAFLSNGVSAHLRNTIVAGNTAGSGPDIRYPGVGGGTGPIVPISVGINLIGNTSGAVAGSFVATDKLNVPAKLGSLQNNGGPTPTMALQSGSLAIDAGSNALAVDPVANVALVTDQRGVFVRIVNGTVDVGAFEFVAARVLKEEALDVLELCLASLNPLAPHYCSSKRHITRAIVNLYRSLTPRLWVSDIQLNTCGGLVFNFEEFAAESLNAEVQSGGQCAADAILAQAAIDDAILGNGNSGHIAKAQDYMANARVAAAKLRYREAIQHYEQAWRRARQALGLLDPGNSVQCRLEENERAACELEHPDGDGDDDDDPSTC